MTAPMVIGVDPGGTTGWAACSMGAIVEREEGPMRQTVRRLITFMRANRERVRAIGVEDQFVGGKPDKDGKQHGNARSSKVIMQRQGFVVGAMFCAGFDELTTTERLWMPLPSVWRKEFGLNAGKRGSIDEATRFYVAARMKLPLAQVGSNWAVAACISFALWDTWARNNSARPHIAADANRR